MLNKPLYFQMRQYLSIYLKYNAMFICYQHHTNNLKLQFLMKGPDIYRERSFRTLLNVSYKQIVLFSANAVQAMVSKDIVHRDLKPQNILMNHEGRSVKNPQPQDIKLKIGNYIGSGILRIFLRPLFRDYKELHNCNIVQFCDL